MAYSEKVIDHYENPRNVGKMDAQDPDADNDRDLLHRSSPFAAPRAARGAVTRPPKPRPGIARGQQMPTAQGFRLPKPRQPSL